MKKILLVFGTGLLINAFLFNCQGGEKPVPPVIACKMASIAPVIDGKLDDACWNECIEAGNFILMAKSSPAAEQTKAYVTYDEKNLYVAFKCFESCLDPVLNQLGAFKAEKKERDSAIWADDSVEVFLSPAEDPSGYYHIAVNSKGIVYDSLGMIGPDSWNAGIKAAGQVGNSYWSVEIAVPLKDLGAKFPETGKYWRINLCRTQRPKSEYSSWSPVDSQGFHNPSVFGSLLFLRDFPAVKDVKFSGSKPGIGGLSVDALNSSRESVDFEVKLDCVFDNEKPIEYKKKIRITSGKTGNAGLEYFVNSENNCLKLEAVQPEATCGAQSVSIPLKPGAEYEFSAVVKSENVKADKSFPFFYMCVYDKDGKESKLYDPLGFIDPSWKDWHEVRGNWKAPENAASGIFWIVKWKGPVTGTFEMDHLVFSEKDSGVNLLPNGDFSKGNEVAGWVTMSDAFSFAGSYGFGDETCSVSYSFFSDGNLIYESPALKSKIENLEYPIKSGFYYFGEGMSKYFSYQISEMYIAAGTAEMFPLVLQSSKRDRIEKVNFELEMPDYCELATDFDQRYCPGPLELKEDKISRDGFPYRKYTVVFGPESVSDSTARSFEFIPIPLVIKAAAAPGNASSFIYHKAWLNETEKENKERRICLKILSPLTDKKPDNLPLALWGPDTERLEQLSPAEKRLLISKWGASGYNHKSGALVHEVNAMFCAAGMKPFTLLPTIHLPAAFPGSLKYLRENPRYYEKDAAGNKVDVINLAHILDKDCPFHEVMKKVIAEYADAFPDHLDWDHEFSPVATGSAGFSEENIKLFRRMENIPSGQSLIPEKILKEFREQWIDFRCRQNAEIAGIYRRMIKAVKPDCLFSVYCGYQSPATKEHYGIDWKYAGENCDYVTCGYGRGGFNETIRDSGKKYIGGGELVWGGYYDLNSFENTIFQRLADCGSYLTYCGWILDGRFFKSSSRAASVASDFEEFFLEHNRKDGLVAGADGNPRSDIAVLEHNGERLIFIFNNGGETKKVEFKNLHLPADAMALDYDSKTLFPQADILSAEVAPWRVKVIFIGRTDDNVKLVLRDKNWRQTVWNSVRYGLELITGKIKAPVITRKKDYEQGVFRWNDKDGGRNKYMVQYSKNKNFKNAVMVSDIPANYFVPPVSTNTGDTMWYCRVKSVNAFTGRESQWSDKSGLKVAGNGGVKPVTREYVYAMENPSIEKWGYICDHWFTPFSSWQKDYQEVFNGHKYSLKITSPYEETHGYLANWQRRGPNGSRLIKIRPGEKCALTAQVKATGESVKPALCLVFINQDGKILPAKKSAPLNPSGN